MKFPCPVSFMIFKVLSKRRNNGVVLLLSSSLPSMLLLCLVHVGSSSGSDVLSYEVVEEMIVGTVIGDVKVDANLTSGGSDGDLRLKFLTPLPPFISFDEASSRLSTCARVDRERICRHDDDDDEEEGEVEGGKGEGGTWPEGVLGDSDSCRIERNLAVRSSNMPVRILKIVIIIADINDNRPTFDPNHLTLTVPESASVGSTSLVLPAAKDRDARRFSVHEYLLESDDEDDRRKFRLETFDRSDYSLAPKLILAESLDRETKEMHEYRVVAVDGGSPPLRGSLRVTVSVLDSNDNAPIFGRSTYQVEIAENAPPGSTVVVVEASDADSGENGHVIYGLSPSTKNSFGSIFAMNGTTGVLRLLAGLDREEQQFYHLRVVANDAGPGSIPGEANVVVGVRDVNDNEPKISVNTLHESGASEARVLSNSPPGTFVGHVIGKDRDEGRNGQFNCSLENNFFRLKPINRDEYHLVTSSRLDRHPSALPQEHAVTITCQDFGVPALKSIKRLLIHAIDSSDKTPRFTQPTFKVEIMEDLQAGHSVLRLSVFEAADFSDEIPRSFSLRGVDSSAFEVEANTGVVRVSGGLDREVKDELAFEGVVTATTASQVLSSTCRVLVVLLDANDNGPRFASRSFEFRMVEENNPGSFVGLVVARDPDSFPNDRFQYELASASSEAPLRAFRIDRFSGRITSTRTLDRERTPSYRLEAIARDDRNSSLFDVASVVVELVDLNDNPPVFLFPNETRRSVTAPAPLSQGSLLTTVSAVDADSGPNCELRFYMTRGDGLRFFHLDSRTGELYLAQSIDHETNQSFVLTVTAYDGGKPPLWSSSDLHVLFRPTPYLSASSLFFYLFDSGGNSERLRSDVLPTFVVCLVTLVLIVLLLAAIFKVSRQKSRAVGDFFLKETSMEAKQSPEYENSAYNSAIKSGNKTNNNIKCSDGRNSIVVVRNGKTENKLHDGQSNAT